MSTELDQPPLATLLVVGYNQEQFIRESIEGALAQTYSPLEIILADDCSTDRTFDIMQEMAAQYRGPHRVLVDREPRNVKLVRRVNSAIKLASAEWVVINAGDDISLPDRVAEHMKIAVEHPTAYSSFLAPLVFGDENEKARVPQISNRVLSFPETLRNYGGGILGATHAFKKSSWQVFGDLPVGVATEDWVIAFRSSLLGSVVWSEVPGVRYRVHARSFTSLNFGKEGQLENYCRQFDLERNALKAFAQDLKKALELGLVDRSAARVGLDWLRHAVTSNEAILACLRAGGIARWLQSSLKLLTCKNFVVGNYRRRLGVVLQGFPYGIPVGKG